MCLFNTFRLPFSITIYTFPQHILHSDKRANIISTSQLAIRRLAQCCVAVTLCWLILVNSLVFAQDLQSGSGSDSRVNFLVDTHRFLDKSASISLDQILGFSDEQWEPVKGQITGYHFWEADYWAASEGAVLWLKVQLPNSAHSEKLWLELLPNVGIDGKIALFGGGKWAWQAPVKHTFSGSSYLPAKHLTFLLDRSRIHQTVYIRLTTEQTFQFSLKISALDELPQSFMVNNLFFGVVAGMLLLAMIYNLAIGLNAKEPVYLYYAFYVFCNLLYAIVMEGYSRLLFPEWGSSAIVSNSSTILVVLSATFFLRKFLDTQASIPRFDVLLRAMIVLFVVWMVCLTFVPDLYAYLLTILLGSTSPVLALFAGLLAYRQGHPMARYFLIAWSLFLISAGCWGWMWLGAIEPKEWVVWFYLLGTLLEVVLLSMVLGFRFNTLKTQTQTLHAAKSRYRELSETDELTQVLNRRGFIKNVERHVQTCNKGNLVWLALDVDNFKRFNDLYGHPAGDDLLQKMGDLLNRKGRKENVVGRIGGEEFAILLVNCPLPNAQYFIDRLLIDFALLNVTTTQGDSVSTTLSIGATAIQTGESIEQVWKRADELLYKAKEQGRNRAVLG